MQNDVRLIMLKPVGKPTYLFINNQKKQNFYLESLIFGQQKIDNVETDIVFSFENDVHVEMLTIFGTQKMFENCGPKRLITSYFL